MPRPVQRSAREGTDVRRRLLVGRQEGVLVPPRACRRAPGFLAFGCSARRLLGSRGCSFLHAPVRAFVMVRVALLGKKVFCFFICPHQSVPNFDLQILIKLAVLGKIQKEKKKDGCSCSYRALRRLSIEKRNRGWRSCSLTVSKCCIRSKEGLTILNWCGAIVTTDNAACIASGDLVFQSKPNCFPGNEGSQPI